MDFKSNPTPKRRKQTQGHVSVIQDSEATDDLSFYSFPPVGKIDLLEVNDMVDERLSILEVFEELKISEMGHTKNLPDHLGTITERLKQVTTKYGDNFITTLHARTLGAHNALKIDARRRDQISHFLLRLFFCTPQDKKNWFVARESELLRYRLLKETVGINKQSKIVAKMIADNQLNFEPITLDDSKESRDLKQNALFYSLTVNDNDKAPIYRIRFEEALDVVRTRKAYVERGFAYVTTHDMISLICHRFRGELNYALSRLVQARPDEDNRLIPLISNIYMKKIASARKMQTDASGNLKEVITPHMVDGLALEHFPPCMENIHLNLRKNHHIKYNGRLHYSLFLKGIGLSLEDAIKFFRDEFIQKIPPEKFDKEYRYGIRYNYGKEGKKVDFSPYGCEKIINSSPGIGDIHGCPFKHFEPGMLKKYLSRKGASDEVIESIETLLEEKNYSKACSVYFSVRHPGHKLPEDGITHPNSFYSESKKALAKNPKREDIMIDDEIDNFLLPEETRILTQETTSSQNDEEESEPMDATETNESTISPKDFTNEQTMEDFGDKPDHLEPDSLSELEVIKRVNETIDSSKLETLIERIDDEPKEQEADYLDEPEQ
ncbi:DNA primase large subunit-like [Panonychus citri]|uniref:DNA primase large subunit-like n=1 Tax=Panonychus citri TaxID=50023 RepID=UPI002307B51B|nr:DNA primase large subunit-like [Panonychus citri]